MPATMTRQQFVKKWLQMRLKETSAAQSHFNDVCALVGHPTPTQYDPSGEKFTFEAPSETPEGGQGRADVWYKGKFIWEYKGAHADLDKAYQQLLRYREALGNPPLLITSDLNRIVIHTNFTGTMTMVHEVNLATLEQGDGLALLKRVFFDPESFEPDVTRDDVTKATADTFCEVAETLQKWGKVSGDQYDPERLAHFLVRLLFCLFAEDMGLLPEEVFSGAVEHGLSNAHHFEDSLRELFARMRTGGSFGFYRIRHFDGGLFNDDWVPELPGDVPHKLMEACRQDWRGINPSIFGTLFERVIDETKRAQLGAHYTGENDILLVVEPVLMQPLRARWHELRRQATHLIKTGQDEQARALLREFADRLGRVRVLDPACGSGNFLYVALRLLLDLQKEVIAFSVRNELGEIELTVSPSQLYGIEINPYAHELAQITVWIGYIQWRFENGYGDIEDPVLRPLENIKQMDAILAYDAQGDPVGPEWPEAYATIGNPPFLGSRKMRPVLGDAYCNALMEAYRGRMQGLPDLVCYWFEKARGMLESGRVQRVGLLATQAIRGKANRQVLDRIKQTGNIFLAWSDRNWVLDGAMVHVSIIGFDGGQETNIVLDDSVVSIINADLTSTSDLTKAQMLPENLDIAFQGDVPRGEFTIPESVATRMLAATNNPTGRTNSDVIRPWRNASDLTQRSSNHYIIDFGLDATEEQAAQYIEPFAWVREHVYPARQQANQASARARWWLHWNPRPRMRERLAQVRRYIATPRVSKHRVFVWFEQAILPDCALVVFARDDDYFLGVLQSHAHELWARGQGSQLREAESGFRYTSSTTFETYPLPWPSAHEPQDDDRFLAIASAARELDAFRQAWLNPPGAGVSIGERMLAKRTLTNLYNALEKYRAEVKGKRRNPQAWDREIGGIITLEEIEELDQIHQELDRAVLDAYGWPHTLGDEEILARLLALNLERAKAQE